MQLPEQKSYGCIVRKLGLGKTLEPVLLQNLACSLRETTNPQSRSTHLDGNLPVVLIPLELECPFLDNLVFHDRLHHLADSSLAVG